MATAAASLNSDASPASAALPPSLTTTTSSLPKGAITANRTTLRMSELHQRLANCSESDVDWNQFQRLHRVRINLSSSAFPDPLAQQPANLLDS